MTQNYASIARKRGSNLSAEVETILMERSGRLIPMAEVAELFCISSRSLSRRIKQEGKSYRLILCNVQAQVAKEQLSKSSARVSEISRSMGYASTSNFIKAFRSWTGTTPSGFRAESHRENLGMADGLADILRGSDIDSARSEQ